MRIIQNVDESLDSVGKRIKEARKKRSISGQKLGELIGKSYSYISNYENGIRNPSDKVLLKISEALDISFFYLKYGNSSIEYDNNGDIAMHIFYPSDDCHDASSIDYREALLKEIRKFDNIAFKPSRNYDKLLYLFAKEISIMKTLDIGSEDFVSNESLDK